MSANSKSILYIDLLNQNFELKAHKNLSEYLGGVGLGLKLLLDNFEKDPKILACGPLSGIFPYTSKLALLHIEDKDVKELYGGGSFAAKMRLSDIDAIILYNEPKKPLTISISEGKVDFIEETNSNKLAGLGASGKRSFLRLSSKTRVDDYFGFGGALNVKNLKTLIISGEGEIKIPNIRTYNEIYNNILDKRSELSVKYSTDPSCWGCPAGCNFSCIGETKNVAVLPRCLIACQFAEDIYKEIPLVFSCLTVLGLKYNHDHLEKIPDLVGELRRSLKAL